MKQRKRFCELWLKRQDDLKYMIFVDEKTFNGFDHYNRSCRRKRGAKTKSSVFTVKRNNAKCNIFGFIGSFGKGNIY